MIKRKIFFYRKLFAAVFVCLSPARQFAQSVSVCENDKYNAVNKKRKISDIVHRRISLCLYLLCNRAQPAVADSWGRRIIIELIQQDASISIHTSGGDFFKCRKKNKFAKEKWSGKFVNKTFFSATSSQPAVWQALENDTFTPPEKSLN